MIMSDASQSWMDHLQDHVDRGLPELILGEVRDGDVVVVDTQHTRYVLRWREDGTADLETGRADRPSGRVRVQGCTFGASSSIKPTALFTGGNLEFLWQGGAMRHRTTSICALHWVRRTQT